MQTLKVPEKLVMFSGMSYIFIVYGCGGTGAYFVRDLFRIVSVNNKQFGRRDKILLIDGDQVEEHNLLRQNFIQADIGKNKAQVLAERYGNAFGVETGFIPRYLNEATKEQIRNCFYNYVPVHIGCVDNNKTRHMIHDLYRSARISGSVYIDSGNEQDAGQVVFSCSSAFTVNGSNMSFYPSSYNIVKDAVEMFRLEADDRHPDDLSCAERAVHSPQNIATNIMAGNVIFNYCNAILAPYNGINTALNSGSIFSSIEISEAYRQARTIPAHVTYFNSRTGAITTQGFEPAICERIERARKDREDWLTREKQRLKYDERETAAV